MFIIGFYVNDMLCNVWSDVLGDGGSVVEKLMDVFVEESGSCLFGVLIGMMIFVILILLLCDYEWRGSVFVVD